MGAAVKGRSEVAREGGAGQRRVTVEISGLAFEALEGAEAGSTGEAPGRMASALRCYLGDRGTARPAWPYPSFLRGSETQADVPVQFDVEADLWREFETEASTQGVSIDQLAEHAAFYFAAEANAGNLTQRILDDLGRDDGEE
jgi:hypothetical protein